MVKNLPSIILSFFILAAAAVPAYAQLPQYHDYQLTLRDYLGTLNQGDFEVELSGLGYDDSYFENADDLFRMWIMLENRGRLAPSSRGFRTEARFYTLSEIERDGNVYMDVGNWFIEPVQTAWWAQWDYPGNPHYGSRAVKLRAFVAAAVDMMMLDDYHENQGRGMRSDFLGASLIRFGYTYGVVQDILPENVRDAYEYGMRKMFGKIEDWGPTGIHADMDQFALVGMWYVADSMDDEGLRQRAADYMHRLYDNNYNRAGFMDHGGGYDGSYQGITFYFNTWAALASQNEFLQEKVGEMSRLKGALTFPEPDGDWLSPSHFATANDEGPAKDQWAPYQRDYGKAMLSDDAKYLIWSGRNWPAWYNTGVPDESELRSNIASDIHREGLQDNIGHDVIRPSSRQPQIWSENHWLRRGTAIAYEYYRDGFYQEMRDLKQMDSPVLKAPFEREENFTEQFGDDFLVAKRNGYGIAVHTGGLSGWGDHTRVAGLSGGALSVFWTPQTGSVIMGRSRGYQNPEDPDRWEDWRLWNTHAISGVTGNGNPFSSARERSPESLYDLDSEIPYVSVTGTLNGGNQNPGGGLNGTVTYSRKYEVLENGVRVRSEINPEGSNEIRELYEMIPIFHRDERSQSSSVESEIWVKINGNWQQADTDLRETDLIRVDRFNGSVYIEFESPKYVKLSPAMWTSDYQTKSRARNIMVDLTGASGEVQELVNASISYSIHNGDQEGEGGTEREKPAETTLSQNFPNPFNPSTQIQFTLTETQQVSLRVYNLTGQLITTLIDGTVPGGTHQVTFNAGNLASGIYIYRLITEKEKITYQMTFIK